MQPKMTVADAAKFLNTNTKQILKFLKSFNLPFSKEQGIYYFEAGVSKQVFNINLRPKAFAFQIVKGGTGKTSLAHSFAIRAYLYGLKVLCIDLDQQGNLTQSLGVDAEESPILIDVLAEDEKVADAIVEVLPNLDLLPSRIENAALDDVIRIKKWSLEEVYKLLISAFKQHYDLIIVDCPPNLGPSVAAMTIAVDEVVAPVIPENFALAGLRASFTAMQELKVGYGVDLGFKIVLNRYEPKHQLCQRSLELLCRNSNYSSRLLPSLIRLSREFPVAAAQNISIFDQVKPSGAKYDIDMFTRSLLGIGQVTPHPDILQARLCMQESLV